MPRLRLTDAAIKRVRLPARNEPQIDLWDTISPVAIRLSYGGARSWICQPRVLREGRWVPARITLGRWPEMSLADARRQARAAVDAAADGKDPKGMARTHRALLEVRSRDTFALVAEDFMARYFNSHPRAARTKAAYKQLLLVGEDLANWRDRPISSITRRDVLDVIDQIMDRDAPATANRTLAYLKRFLSWCVEREILLASPVAGMRRPAEERARDRALSAKEIPEVWAAFDAEGGMFGSIFKLLLLTGQRRGEVAGLTIDELVDLDGAAAQWELPSTRTKNGRPHVVPLAPQAVAILKSRPRFAGSRLLFTAGGKAPTSGLSKAKDRIDSIIAANRKAAGIAEAMPHWTAHDLRRTFSTGTHGEPLSVPPHVVEAVLNHISGHRAGVAGTYNRALYREEKKRALEAWADYLDRLIGA